MGASCAVLRPIRTRRSSRKMKSPRSSSIPGIAAFHGQTAPGDPGLHRGAMVRITLRDHIGIHFADRNLISGWGVSEVAWPAFFWVWAQAVEPPQETIRSLERVWRMANFNGHRRLHLSAERDLTSADARQLIFLSNHHEFIERSTHDLFSLGLTLDISIFFH